MKKLLIKSFVRLILSYVYAFVGGCVLYAIERKPETNEEISSRLSQKLHRDFILKFNISINESDFKCFMQKAFDVVTVGNKMDWSILSGLSFTMTSLTTIGKWFNYVILYLWFVLSFCFNSNTLKIHYTLQNVLILEKSYWLKALLCSLTLLKVNIAFLYFSLVSF